MTSAAPKAEDRALMRLAGGMRGEITSYASPARTPRGRDILAACGQLKSDSEKLRARVRTMLEESLAVGQD